MSFATQGKLADGPEGNLQGRMPLRLVLVALELLNLVGLQKLLGNSPEGHTLSVVAAA